MCAQLDAQAKKVERLTQLVASMSGRGWDEHRRAVLAEQEARALARCSSAARSGN